MREETAAGAVIGLQEVDLTWAGKLHTFFAEQGYVAVFAQYGSSFSGYMGVMLAWPREKFETLDVDISKISDTAPPGTWPEQAKERSHLAPFGFLTFNGLKEVLGCRPPELGVKEENFEWNLAKQRGNEAIFARLRPRSGGPAFCVSTYHMPCLFGPPEKVRVVNIHTYLLLLKLKAFAGKDPAVLMGDFNFKPGTSPYLLAASGGEFAVAATSTKENGGAEEVKGLEARLLKGQPPWPGGLKSAYCAFHKEEPLFTNFAFAKGMSEAFLETLDYIWYTDGPFTVVECPKLPVSRAEVNGPFPNQAEPSDHLLLKARMRLTGQRTRT